MNLLLLLVGLILAVVIVAGSSRFPFASTRTAAAVKSLAALVAIIVLIVFAALSSIRYIGENEVGVIVKNFGKNMPAGQIISLRGEKGPQARILGPGWHFWYFPGLYDVRVEQVTEINSAEVGLLSASDGLPLPKGQAFAAEWNEATFSRMLDAEFFLGEGGGFKGPQASVLKPGKWRVNTKLFSIERVPVTNIEKATVGVIKSNVGDTPPDVTPGETKIVARGQRGIWREPYTPQKLYLNTKAYEVTKISTMQQIIFYGIGGATEETEITVRTSDGFTFPVDVRIEYQIRPEDAPNVVAELGDDTDQLRKRLASTVRAIFRNNAEDVKALDYVQQRSQQEETTRVSLAEEMASIGVSISAVRIGQIGDEASLGTLLKTQTDREIALQEQLTFQEQQRAAEQKKNLERTEQEAQEERRLATEEYEKKMETVRAERVVIEAKGEAEAIQIKAEAQAQAYSVIAQEIGQGNAALLELLKIIGESGINITPRVMVIGNGGDAGGGEGGSAETTALIGTMLDTMIDKSPEKE